MLLVHVCQRALPQRVGLLQHVVNVRLVVGGRLVFVHAAKRRVRTGLQEDVLVPLNVSTHGRGNIVDIHAVPGHQLHHFLGVVAVFQETCSDGLHLLGAVSLRITLLYGARADSRAWVVTATANNRASGRIRHIGAGSRAHVAVCTGSFDICVAHAVLGLRSGKRFGRRVGGQVCIDAGQLLFSHPAVSKCNGSAVGKGHQAASLSADRRACVGVVGVCVLRQVAGAPLTGLDRLEILVLAGAPVVTGRADVSGVTLGFRHAFFIFWRHRGRSACRVQVIFVGLGKIAKRALVVDALCALLQCFQPCGGCGTLEPGRCNLFCHRQRRTGQGSSG